MKKPRPVKPAMGDGPDDEWLRPPSGSSYIVYSFGYQKTKRLRPAPVRFLRNLLKRKK